MNMGTNEVETKHPSYGMISLSRISAHGRALFGSSITHENSIELTISRASDIRDLHRNWYNPREELIRVEMSPTQFVEAMTTMNTTGIPCTIIAINRERQEPCPLNHVRQLGQNEFKKRLQEVLGKSAKAAKLAEFPSRNYN